MHVCECAVDDVRSCTDASDSSGTVTNDDSFVTVLRHHNDSEHERSHLSVAGMLQLTAASDAAEIAKKCASPSRCSVCSQDQVRNATVEGSQQKTEAQLSDEERRFLELQRSRGAIPKCRLDRRPRSHSGNVCVLYLYFDYKEDL